MRARPHERILDAAVWLFQQEGIQAVGVNRIVADADVAPMTLYRHFGSKDQLVALALEQWSAQWLQWLAEQIDRQGDDPGARLAGLWDTLEEWWASDGFRGSFVVNAAVELRSQPDHPAHTVATAHRMALRQFLEDLAKPTGADDPATIAANLEVLVHGATAVAVLASKSDAAVARALANAALASESRPAAGTPTP